MVIIYENIFIKFSSKELNINENFHLKIFHSENRTCNISNTKRYLYM